MCSKFVTYTRYWFFTVNFEYAWLNHLVILQFSISRLCSISIRPENVRKAKVFWLFGYRNETLVWNVLNENIKWPAVKADSRAVFQCDCSGFEHRVELQPRNLLQWIWSWVDIVVFKTLSSICDGVFCKKCERVFNVYYFSIKASS